MLDVTDDEGARNDNQVKNVPEPHNATSKFVTTEMKLKDNKTEIKKTTVELDEAKEKVTKLAVHKARLEVYRHELIQTRTKEIQDANVADLIREILKIDEEEGAVYDEKMSDALHILEFIVAKAEEEDSTIVDVVAKKFQVDQSALKKPAFNLSRRKFINILFSLCLLDQFLCFSLKLELISVCLINSTELPPKEGTGHGDGFPDFPLEVQPVPTPSKAAPNTQHIRQLPTLTRAPVPVVVPLDMPNLTSETSLTTVTSSAPKILGLSGPLLTESAPAGPSNPRKRASKTGSVYLNAA